MAERTQKLIFSKSRIRRRCCDGTWRVVSQLISARRILQVLRLNDFGGVERSCNPEVCGLILTLLLVMKTCHSAAASFVLSQNTNVAAPPRWWCHLCCGSSHNRTLTLLYSCFLSHDQSLILTANNKYLNAIVVCNNHPTALILSIGAQTFWVT